MCFPTRTSHQTGASRREIGWFRNSSLTYSVANAGIFCNLCAELFECRGFEKIIMRCFHKSICVALISSTFYFSAWAAGPAVGEKPPLLQADELLQAPGDAKVDAESLRGKVVILEFWATWCGPCVAAIPHMNELAEKFINQPV